MRTVQMSLEDDLVQAVDRAAKTMKTSRSAFARTAFRDALLKFKAAQLEARHRRGYAVKPVQKGEFDTWGAEQAWGKA